MYKKVNPYLEALGYGPDDRLVIFHADDIGMSRGRNQAYLDLQEAGIVKSGSVMVPCPWSGEILAYAQKNPALDLGVHLTLTCEHSHYRWGPVSPIGIGSGMGSDAGSSLVANDGRFWSTLEELSQHANVEAADAEVRAQAEYMRSLGINFTHIDTHMGASLIPQLSASYVTLGFEHRVPVLLPRQLLLKDNRSDDLEQLETMGMALVDDFRITPVYTENPPAKPSAEAYETVLKALPPGIIYFSLHPNTPGDIEHISPHSAAWRIFEHEYFQSQQLREFLEANAIIPIGYREICEAMQAKVPH